MSYRTVILPTSYIFYFLSHFVSSFMYTFHPMTWFFVKYVAHFEYFTFHPKMTTTKTQTITKTTGCLSEVEYNKEKNYVMMECHLRSVTAWYSHLDVFVFFSLVLNLSVIAWYLVFFVNESTACAVFHLRRFCVFGWFWLRCCCCFFIYIFSVMCVSWALMVSWGICHIVTVTS